MLQISTRGLKISRSNIGRNFGRVTFGEAIYQPKGICGPRIQTDYQFVAVLEGDVLIEIGPKQKSVKLLAQQAILLRPGQREMFQFSSRSMARHVWCAIHPDLVHADQVSRLPAEAQVLPFSLRQQQLFEIGLGLPYAELAPSDELFESLAISLLHMLAFENHGSGKGRTYPEPLERAIKFALAHLSDPLDLQVIAGNAFITKQHLNRLFKEHLAQSPMKWVWKKRVERGVNLLRETGLGVQEISHQTGFQSPYHFSRMVKEETGQSPRSLRSQAWQEGS
jgi:AraC-like DNA-binding protein